jgi:hypothetical protein
MLNIIISCRSIAIKLRERILAVNVAVAAATIVPNANGTCRYDGNEERPKCDAIAVMSVLVRIQVQELMDPFREDEAIGREDGCSPKMISQITRLNLVQLKYVL